jgi:uncharacterized protein YjiS (DUF1127 family)
MSIQVVDRLARMPGLAALHASPLVAIFKRVAAWFGRCSQRRAMRELAEDKRLLNDIGLTREQVLSESDKPFWRQ